MAKTTASALTFTRARIPLDQLETHPDFSARVPYQNDEHLRELIQPLKANPKKALDPILVWSSPDGVIFILDGHYRAEAARQAKRRTITAKVFHGTRDEALLLSPRENAKAKLPLTGEERADWAWKMTRMEPPEGKVWRFTPAQIAEAIGGGERRCWMMRNRFKAVQAEGPDAVAALTGRWHLDMREDAKQDDMPILSPAEEARQLNIMVQRLRDTCDHRKHPDLPILRDYRLQRKAQVMAFGAGYAQALANYDEVQKEDDFDYDAPFMEFHFLPNGDPLVNEDEDHEPDF